MTDQPSGGGGADFIQGAWLPCRPPLAPALVSALQFTAILHVSLYDQGRLTIPGPHANARRGPSFPFPFYPFPFPPL